MFSFCGVSLCLSFSFWGQNVPCPETRRCSNLRLRLHCRTRHLHFLPWVDFCLPWSCLGGGGCVWGPRPGVLFCLGGLRWGFLLRFDWFCWGRSWGKRVFRCSILFVFSGRSASCWSWPTRSCRIPWWCCPSYYHCYCFFGVFDVVEFQFEDLVVHF